MKTFLIIIVALVAVAAGAILVVKLINFWENETDNKH